MCNRPPPGRPAFTTKHRGGHFYFIPTHATLYLRDERRKMVQDALSFWPVIIAIICGFLATAGVGTFIVTTLLAVGSGYLMVCSGVSVVISIIATLFGWVIGLILRHVSPDTFDATIDTLSYVDFSGGDCGGSFDSGSCDGGGGGD